MKTKASRASTEGWEHHSCLPTEGRQPLCTVVPRWKGHVVASRAGPERTQFSAKSTTPESWPHTAKPEEGLGLRHFWKGLGPKERKKRQREKMLDKS